MRFCIIYLIYLLFFLWSCCANESDLCQFELEQWKIFKEKFAKVYDNFEEEEKRKNIFMVNLDLIQSHNARRDHGLETFDVEVNAFADLTNDEFMGQMAGYRVPQSLQKRGIPFFPMNSGSLPPSVDWRKRGAVTPVKNQWVCASSWAFSATGALEGQHFRKTGKLLPLSEQNLIDCSMTQGNQGCKGGCMESAFQYVINNNGIDTDQSYPYEGWDRSCRFNVSNVGANATDYVELPPGSEYHLQIAVNEIGPISAAMHASGPSFQFYRSGVYHHHQCSKTDLNHGVLVVGYGIDWWGGEYWIVKNSWGSLWGQNGYFLLARNRENACGIATHPTFPTV